MFNIFIFPHTKGDGMGALRTINCFDCNEQSIVRSGDCLIPLDALTEEYTKMNDHPEAMMDDKKRIFCPRCKSKNTKTIAIKIF
jgi:Zn finger protein HypA/HybF involved in hydrogenase expression